MPLKTLLIVVLAGLISSPQKAHAQVSPKQPKAGDSWLDHGRRSTISFGTISTVAGKQTFNVVASGVVVSPDRVHIFFVTAKHVFDEPAQGWHPAELHVRSAIEEGKSFTEEIGIPLPLKDAKGNNLWSSLADGSDIAGILISNAFAPILTDGISYEEFARDDDVYDGASVFVIGYPGATQMLAGPNSLVRAVTRSGIIAWTDPNGPLANPLLLDADILPGNSGGPAFRVPTGLDKAGNIGFSNRAALLGIVTEDLTGYYTVQADGRVVQVKFADLPLPSIAQVRVVGVGGLGKVEPASKVKILLDTMMKSLSSQ